MNHAGKNPRWYGDHVAARLRQLRKIVASRTLYERAVTAIPCEAADRILATRDRRIAMEQFPVEAPWWTQAAENRKEAVK